MPYPNRLGNKIRKCKTTRNYLSALSFVFVSMQESFEGQMTEDNIELGVCNEQGFRRLTPAEVKDYLASIIS